MGAKEEANPRESSEPRIVGRFEMHEEIASGGFASVHLGRTRGAGGFSKLVAIKRLHSQFAQNDDVRTMFLDEARVVARVQHTNVVPTLDFIEEDGELFMVMEYVEGVTLGYVFQKLKKQKRKIPLNITLRIMTGTLEGLHAAHEATDEEGNAMGIIHRDVSPDNILIGIDGHARLLDFGVAKALKRYSTTRDGAVKGKMFYITPEQVAGKELDHRTDIFSASVVLWQCLTGRRLFDGDNLGELALKISQQEIPPPSSINKALSDDIDAVVLKGLERDPDQRWPDAEQMAEALQAATRIATPGAVARWVKSQAKDKLAKRAKLVSQVELTPADASSQSSEGQESFKAAASYVVRMPGAPTTEEGTDVINRDELMRRKAERDATASDPGDGPPSSRRGPVVTEQLPKVQLKPQPPPPPPPSEPEPSAPIMAAPASGAGIEPALIEELSLSQRPKHDDGSKKRRRAMYGVATAAAALVCLLIGVVVLQKSGPPQNERVTTPVAPPQPKAPGPPSATPPAAPEPAADTAPAVAATQEEPASEPESEAEEPESEAEEPETSPPAAPTKDVPATPSPAPPPVAVKPPPKTPPKTPWPKAPPKPKPPPKGDSLFKRE